ncbi:hypothetical protein BH20ACI3_BH20ACI3_35170 [soil metagenome]
MIAQLLSKSGFQTWHGFLVRMLAWNVPMACSRLALDFVHSLFRLELLAFQPREQLRYNGVRKVRKVRAVRMEEMPFFLRKIRKCCKTKQKLRGL